ncbi:50S ribosomal protein L11 [Nanoarchaeota archaeon]
MKVKLMVEGGNMKPSPAISQKIGPLGLNMGKLMKDVNSSTTEFKGMKVPVTLNIDSKTKEVKVEVLSPPTSEMIKKEFGIEKGSSQPQKIKVANASIEQLIKVAKSKQSLEKDLKSTVKTMVGCCRSLGILIESKEPKIITPEIDEGVYDKQINEGLTEPSKEKLDELNAFFEKIKLSQEEQKKKEEEEKAKAEEEKTAAAAAAAATPAAGATGAPAKEAKPAEEKKK